MDLCGSTGTKAGSLASLRSNSRTLVRLAFHLPLSLRTLLG
jgi:hypothetical protein